MTPQELIECTAVASACARADERATRRKETNQSQDEQKELRKKYEEQQPGKDEQKEENAEKQEDDDDEGPAALMDPTVLGKIIWLRPANKFAIMFGANDKDLVREGVKGSKEDEDKKKKGMDDETWFTMQSEKQEFDPREIAADAVALCSVRLANQSFQDHYLGSYRCGLSMPVRMLMQSEYAPEKCGKEDEQDDDGDGEDKS